MTKLLNNYIGGTTIDLFLISYVILVGVMKMRKRYRYGIFIASAILACAPLAMNNSVAKADAVEGQKEAQGTTGAAKPAAGNINGQQADQTSKASGNDQQKQGQKGISQTGNDQTDPNQKGDTVATAKEINITYDKEIDTETPIKVKAVNGLTEQDVKDYVDAHTHVSIGGQPTASHSVDTVQDKNKKSVAYDPNYQYYGPDEIDIIPSFSPHSKNQGQQIDYSKAKPSMLLNDGDVIQIVAVPDKLTPNKWYKWKLQNGVTNVVASAENKLGAKLPKGLTDRINENADGEIAEKTDSDGVLPSMSDKGDNETTEIDLGKQDMAHKITFIITETDGIEIPHSYMNLGRDRNVINGVLTGNTIVWNDNNKSMNITTTAKPGTGRPEKPDNPDQDITDENTSNWTDTPDDGTDFQPVVANTENEAIPTNEPDVNLTDASKPEIEPRVIANNLDDLVFIHTSFVYDENGNFAIDDGSYQFRRKNQKVEVLDDGRLYKINGEDYCKISDSPARYVKAADIGVVVNKTQKVRVSGKINASSRYSVPLYNSDGDAINILTKTKHVSFDQKKHMNGHTYYRIKGTKYWVRKGSIDFASKTASKKTQKK